MENNKQRSVTNITLKYERVCVCMCMCVCVHEHVFASIQNYVFMLSAFMSACILHDCVLGVAY